MHKIFPIALLLFLSLTFGISTTTEADPEYHIDDMEQVQASDLDRGFLFQAGKCVEPGADGARVQIMYARHVSQTDRLQERLPSIQQAVMEADGIYSLNAQRWGGYRHIRYATEPDCTLIVQTLVLTDTEPGNWFSTMKKLRATILSPQKHIVFAEVDVCGVSTFLLDDRKDENYNETTSSIAIIGPGCMYGGAVAHELAHGLGAVALTAPNSDKDSHCTDEYDIMCYTSNRARFLCPMDGIGNATLDCNGDDYFSLAPTGWLKEHRNIADSRFFTNRHPQIYFPSILVNN